MIKEAEELETKLVALENFIESNPIYLDLSITDQTLMGEQLRVMCEYYNILKTRIDRA